VSNLIAVDIALLPPTEITSQIIDLTSQLPSASTRLNAKDCLPHITLAMGLLDPNSLNLAANILKSYVDIASELDIKLSDIQSYKLQDSSLDSFSELVVGQNPKLTTLHLEIMNAFEPMLTFDDVGSDNFISPPLIAEQSIYWVENYLDHHKAASNFRPHITLGEGVIQKHARPIYYSGSRLALCHLGTYCTCRKILFKA